jgi:hypothetical protein
LRALQMVSSMVARMETAAEADKRAQSNGEPPPPLQLLLPAVLSARGRWQRLGSWGAA